MGEHKIKSNGNARDGRTGNTQQDIINEALARKGVAKDFPKPTFGKGQ